MPRRKDRPRRVSWLIPLLIALVTFAAFLPALQSQFVWDDEENILGNPHYRGLGWSHLRWMWTTHLGHYIPLTWMSLGLDYVLWGLNPLGYHLSNLLLHAANAVVFFFVGRRILSRALPSLSERGHALAVSAGFAALVFAIHPLRVESVAWVTERRDVLSALFYLSAILVYLRACEREERGREQYWAAAGLFACALLSKSMAVNLPIVLVILDVYPLRRLGGTSGWWSEPARRVYLEKIPFLLLAAAAAAIAFMAQLSVHAAASLSQLSVPARVAVSAYGLSFYLWKMVVPVNLSPLYELPRTLNLGATPLLLSYGLVLAITAIALALRRGVPGLPAAWLAYVLVLLPVLGIFQSGPQIAADRYTYLAGLGWAILAGAGLLSHWRRRPFLFTGLAGCVLFGLGILTWNQVQVWHDAATLWSHAVAVDPRSPTSQYNAGLALARQGRTEEAIGHYRQALQSKPNYAEAHNNVGAALAGQGKLAEAIDHYRQALKSKPDFALAHYNWGLALAQQGKPAEAIDHYREALRFKPDSADAHTNWGLALTQQGKPAEAIDHYRQALRFNPDDALARDNLGLALAQAGKPAEAIDHYREALNSKPDSADAHINVGLALAQQGKLAEAIDHYRQALQVRPDHAVAHYNWGNALIQQGKPAEASDHYRQALQIKPGYAIAHTNWGVALAQQGKPVEAIEHYRQALQIKPDSAETHANWGLALADQGKLAEASEHYRLALQIKPDSAEVHINWGTALADQGKLAEASEHYQQALRLKPDHATAQSNLLNVMRRLGTAKEDAAASRKSEKTQ